jgi:hypothetical protein
VKNYKKWTVKNSCRLASVVKQSSGNFASFPNLYPNQTLGNFNGKNTPLSILGIFELKINELRGISLQKLSKSLKFEIGN